MSLRDQIVRHEGLRLKPYKDSVGILTIGVGRNLEDVGISESEAMLMLEADIQRATAELVRAFPWVASLDDARRNAMINMSFNLGIGRLRGFAKMLDAMKAGDWEQAANHALDSKWATQVGRRSQELADQIRTGKESL